jgi:hypothetical protein
MMPDLKRVILITKRLNSAGLGWEILNAGTSNAADSNATRARLNFAVIKKSVARGCAPRVVIFCNGYVLAEPT